MKAYFKALKNKLTTQLEQALPAMWYQESGHSSCLKYLMMPLSWVYGLLVAFKYKKHLNQNSRNQKTFNSNKPVLPVIVVGNITVGGTGKTPLVLKLVEHLKKAGYKPAIISRGYGGALTKDNKNVFLVSASSSPSDVGDEPYLMAVYAQIPVAVSSVRNNSILLIQKEHPECDMIISDDGLQHYAMQRDIEIVVIDQQRQFGNQLLLPAGPLREPVKRLNDVDFVLVHQSKISQSNENNHQLSGAIVNHPSVYSMIASNETARHLITGDVLPISSWSGKNVYAFAGIGNPKRFFNSLAKHGMIVEGQAFPDHHSYDVEDVTIMLEAKKIILTTVKDAVKIYQIIKNNDNLQQLAESAGFYVVDLNLTLDAQFESQLLEQLDVVIDSKAH